MRTRRGLDLTNQRRTLLNEFIATERQLRAERTDTSEIVTTALIGGFLLFSLIFSGLLVFLGRRDLTTLSATYSESLRKQQAHAEALEKQAWYRTGQTQLSESIIGELALPALGQGVLNFLSRYIDAAVGALYVVQDGKLQRVAEYAYDPEHLQSARSLEVGTGLVGQAALERRMMALEDLPAGYLKVTSALGDTTPRAVLIVPVEDSGLLNGVIELGFRDRCASRTASCCDASPRASARPSKRRVTASAAEGAGRNPAAQRGAAGAAGRTACRQRGAGGAIQCPARVADAHGRAAGRAGADQRTAGRADRSAGSPARPDGREEPAPERGPADARQRADELQRASRYKSEFLANMSHELRTPLNSSLILAKLLADNPDGNLSEEQVQFARSIYSAGNDLLTLINDILDISKVEAGKLEVHPELTILARLVDGMKSLFLPQAMEKALSFSVELADDLPPTLFTDRQRLEQILKNLLANAFKFTEKGSVTLRVEPRDGGMLAFAVRDTGIGIAPEQQAAIFEAFRQADGTTNRRYGGTGLGLSISRELANLLGGQMSAECAGRRQYLYPGVAAELQRAARRRADHRAAAEPCTGHHGRSDHAAAGAPRRAGAAEPRRRVLRAPARRPRQVPVQGALRAGHRGRAAVRAHPP